MLQVLEPEVRTDGALSMQESQLAHTTCFKNLTGEAVTVIHRTGFTETIRPAASYNRGYLAVTVRRSNSRDVSFNVVANDSGCNGTLDKLYRAQSDRENFNGNLEYTYRIERSKITTDGVYIPELDIVVARGTPDKPIIHPYSNKAAINNQNFTRDGAGATVRIFSIDHDRRAGSDVYVNLFGAVAKIKNQHSDMLGNGVYVALSDCDGVQRVIHHTKESNLLKVFDTYDEASGADALALASDDIKRQIAEYKLKEVQASAQINQLKAKLDDEGRRFDFEVKAATHRLASAVESSEFRNKELSNEVTRLRSQLDAARSDEYDGRAHDRKVALEYFKVAPSLISIAKSALTIL